MTWRMDLLQIGPSGTSSLWVSSAGTCSACRSSVDQFREKQMKDIKKYQPTYLTPLPDNFFMKYNNLAGDCGALSMESSIEMMMMASNH